MSARFHRKETVAAGFRRLVGEQTGLLVSLLADEGGAERIHEARVELKRMRALLHLARSGLDSEVFASENQTYRDTGRKLSQAREAEVNLTIFEALAGSADDGETVIVRTLLQEDAARSHRRAMRATRLASIAATLRARGHALGVGRLEKDEWPLLETALHKGYRRARKLRQIARDPGREKELHESRKRVKRLFYQLEFLRRALGKAACKVLTRLRKLGVLLGEHHDLCVLRATLIEHAAHGVTAAESPNVAEKIEKELARLLKRIRKQANAAFEERPKAFLKALHADWTRWRLGDGKA